MTAVAVIAPAIESFLIAAADEQLALLISITDFFTADCTACEVWFMAEEVRANFFTIGDAAAAFYLRWPGSGGGCSRGENYSIC